MSGKHFVISF